MYIDENTEDKDDLNTVSSDDDWATQLLEAVSEGNDDKATQLLQAPTDGTIEADSSDSTDSPTAVTEENEDEALATDEVADTTQHTLTPAEQRLADLERELSSAKAAVGRMAHVQSRLAQLERELSRRTAASEEKAKKDEDDDKLRARINKLREIDPDTADILEGIRKEALEATKSSQKVTPEVDEDALFIEYQRVLEVHPNAESVFKHPYWHMWKEQLTPEQRAWAESTRSNEVIAALDAFNQFMQGFGGGRERAKEPEVVDVTKQAREQKLQRSAMAADNPIKQAPKFDEDAFFRDAVDRIAKEAGIG